MQQKGPRKRAFFCDALHIGHTGRGARWFSQTKRNLPTQMKEARMSRIHSICALCVLAVLPFAARGEQKDPETEMADAIARRYIVLAGTRENAVALALSLRNGHRVM